MISTRLLNGIAVRLRQNLILTGFMHMKYGTARRVAATPPSQGVPATPRRLAGPTNKRVRRFLRDEGVAPTFCDGASQPPCGGQCMASV